MKKIHLVSCLIFGLLILPSIAIAQLDDIQRVNTDTVTVDDETVTTTNDDPVTTTNEDEEDVNDPNLIAPAPEEIIDEDLIIDGSEPVDESATIGINKEQADSILTSYDELDKEIQAEIDDPGVLPDSPLYFVKRFSEVIHDWLTFDDGKKAELQYAFALRRASEIQKLIEKGKDDVAQKQIAKYEEHLEKFNERINKLADKKPDKADELLNKFEQIQVRQQAVLADVYEDAPAEAKAGILNAIDNSSKGMENAIEKLQSSAELDNYMDRVETRLETEFQNKSQDVKNRLENRIKVNNGNSGNGNENDNSSGNQPGSAGGNNN